MPDAEREQIVQDRMERARDSLLEAELLAKSALWRGCVNCLYYACFYAVSALLLRRGLSSAKHSGVLALFNREYGRTGVVSQDSLSLYRKLFTVRQRGDYEDLFQFSEDDVWVWLERSKAFVGEVADLLRSGH